MGAGVSVPVQTGPEANPGSCTYTYTGSHSPGVQWPTLGFDRPPHLAPRLKKEYGYNSIPPICLRGMLQGELHKLCYRQRGSKLHFLKLLSVFKLKRVFINIRGTLLVAQLIEALRYKSESRGFDSRWCHWIFFIDIILPAATMALGSTQPLTEMSTRNISWG